MTYRAIVTARSHTACIRCHMLSINPKRLPRLDEFERCRVSAMARLRRDIDESPTSVNGAQK